MPRLGPSLSRPTTAARLWRTVHIGELHVQLGRRSSATEALLQVPLQAEPKQEAKEQPRGKKRRETDQKGDADTVPVQPVQRPQWLLLFSHTGSLVAATGHVTVDQAIAHVLCWNAALVRAGAGEAVTLLGAVKVACQDESQVQLDGHMAAIRVVQVQLYLNQTDAAVEREDRFARLTDRSTDGRAEVVGVVYLEIVPARSVGPSAHRTELAEYDKYSLGLGPGRYLERAVDGREWRVLEDALYVQRIV